MYLLVRDIKIKNVRKIILEDKLKNNFILVFILVLYAYS